MNAQIRERLDVIRELLKDEPTTQEELRTKLGSMQYAVTQSTISRDLRKLGAIRTVDSEKRTVYRLPELLEPAMASGNLGGLVLDIRTNGSMVVIRTAVGSASFVARHLDNIGPAEILGTIAGDDTIFVAPASTDHRQIRLTMDSIRRCLM